VLQDHRGNEQHIGMEGAPPWFVKFQGETAAALVTMSSKIENGIMIARNGSAPSGASSIYPLQNDAGDVPPNFPATLADFGALSGAELTGLLAFYGLPLVPGRSDAVVRQKKICPGVVSEFALNDRLNAEAIDRDGIDRGLRCCILIGLY
jgi:hypothetical protein